MFSLRDLCSAIPCEVLTGDSSDVTFSSASIDSRSMQAGQLFFAISGSNSDGHAFVDNAFHAGALGAVVNRRIPAKDQTQLVILVPDTLVALKKLGHLVRSKRNPKVIAITGSTGKTTTKDMLSHVLNAQFPTQKSHSSFNNQYGVPLTLLQLNKDCSHLVVEIGANHHGEIEELAKIAEPDLGIITNIGYAHIENFGSLEGTLREKSELFNSVRKGGTVIINNDDELLRADAGRWRSGTRKFLSVGEGHENDVFARELVFSGGKINGRLHRNDESTPFEINLVGKHFMTAALLASAAAIECGMKLDDIAEALSTFQPPLGRLNVKELSANLWVIDDTYNASPDAMKAALFTLGCIPAHRRIAVLGDMKELGTYSNACHEMIGTEAANSATHLILVGDKADVVRKAAVQSGLDTKHAFVADSATTALSLVRELVQEDSGKTVVLVKGSRFTHMERVVLGLDGVEVECRLSVCSKYINCKTCELLRGK